MNFAVVEDRMDNETGERRIHLMANSPFGYGGQAPELFDEWVNHYLVPSGAQIEISRQNGVYHLHGRWPYRGALDLTVEGWPKFKRFMCWALKGERVSKCIEEGAIYYAACFARWPERAFIRKMPKNVEDGVEVAGVMLFPAEWVPQGCILIGG